MREVFLGDGKEVSLFHLHVPPFCLDKASGGTNSGRTNDDRVLEDFINELAKPSYAFSSVSMGAAQISNCFQLLRKVRPQVLIYGVLLWVMTAIGIFTKVIGYLPNQLIVGCARPRHLL